MTVLVWLTHPHAACWRFQERHARRMRDLLPGVTVRSCSDRDGFLEALPEATVAVVWKFREEWVSDARQLEWIVTPAAGRDYFDVAPRPGLDVDYCSFHGEIMAETVMAFLLGHCRGVVETTRLQATDPWPREALARKMRSLRDSTLLILGFGNIGRWVARLAKPFGVRIVGVKREPTEAPAFFDAADRVLPAAGLDGALPEADFLVVTLPRTLETDGIVDDRRLALLPAHAVVINVGRGNALDEEALAERLLAGRLAAAYLDVYRTEPLPTTSALRACPNVLLMPHASAISPNYLDLFVDEFVEKFRGRYGG